MTILLKLSYHLLIVDYKVDAAQLKDQVAPQHFHAGLGLVRCFVVFKRQIEWSSDRFLYCSLSVSDLGSRSCVCPSLRWMRKNSSSLQAAFEASRQGSWFIQKAHHVSGFRNDRFEEKMHFDFNFSNNAFQVA